MWRCPSQGETSFKTWQVFATRWRAQIPHTDNHGQGHKPADCFMTRDHLWVLAVHGVSWVLEYHVLEAVTTKSTKWNKTLIHKVGSEASVCFQPTAVFCHMLQACCLSTLYNCRLIPQHVEQAAFQGIGQLVQTMPSESRERERERAERGWLWPQQRLPEIAHRCSPISTYFYPLTVGGVRATFARPCHLLPSTFRMLEVWSWDGPRMPFNLIHYPFPGGV